MERLYVIFHMPKTGGTTLRRHFEKHMTPQDDYIHLAPLGIRDARDRRLPPFRLRAPEQRRRARVVFGHWVNQHTARLVPDKTPFRITFVRHPAERLVSAYNFGARLLGEKAKSWMTFDQFVESGNWNSMVDFFLKRYCLRDPKKGTEEANFEAARAALESFDLVAPTETLDEVIREPLRDLGLPTKMQRANVAESVEGRPPVVLDEGLRNRLAQRLPWDLELYERFAVSPAEGERTSASRPARGPAG